MREAEHFTHIYRELATAWETHQSLKMSNAAVPALAESSSRLDAMRQQMLNWHRSGQGAN